MNLHLEQHSHPPVIHPWLKKIFVAFVPGPEITPPEKEFITGLLDHFHRMGHTVQERPDHQTQVLLTTAPFGHPIPWRKSLLFTGRARFHYRHSPSLFTLIYVTPEVLTTYLERLQRALEKSEPDPADYPFPGLAPNAYKVLHDQGRRGGALLTLERVLQAQAKSINILLLVGKDKPETVYHFDLVGAYPATRYKDQARLFQDVVLRIVTKVSTREVREHLIADEPIPASTWKALKTPQAMIEAARRFGERNFFTNTVHIHELVNVPAVSDVISSQYSEGCFATWDTELEALIVTATGSSRPIWKGNITEDDLAVIVGVRPDGQGALVRQVEGKRNDPPSSEAVEMIGMDLNLPKITLPLNWGGGARVPVIRSKLHGHRGIASFNPKLVEFVPLEAPYYLYPVTCATEAQAHGIIEAFSRSEALNNPSDPRQVVFTILPTHGVVIAEKWVPGSAPFQTIWEYFDAGHLRLDPHVPQGPLTYISEGADRMVLKEGEEAMGWLPR